MSNFFEFFAKRHILANLVIVMTVLLGVNTAMRLNREIYPDVEFGVMTIRTVCPGSSSEDIELNITNKIEKELKNVDGLDRVTSISLENASMIHVFVDPDVKDQDEVKSEVRNAVGRVTDFPPEVTESPTITDVSTASQMQVIEVGVSGNVPYKVLREYARQFEMKLRDVPGVSHLKVYGYRAREIRVEVSAKALQNYQIPMQELIMAIRGRNVRGTLGTFDSHEGEKDLVTLSEFEDPLEVGDVVIRSSFDGPSVRIKDLAIVKDDLEEARVMSRINGIPTISYVVHKTESADIIHTADKIKELIEQEQQYLPEGVELLYSADLSKYVRNRFNVVVKNALIGLGFVMLILAIFLNLRASFWVAMGIPVSLLGTIFLLPLFGVSLDSVTLASMILVFGIIVDDGIIIAENIYRRREMGDSPLRAAVEGIREVFLPVLTTVITTFLAFAPMFFMTGVFGKFTKVIPLTISLALFISLGEAMVALPAHLLPGLRRDRRSSGSRGWFDFLRHWYRGVMSHILRLRYIVVPLFIAILGAALWYGGTHFKFVLFPSKMATDFFVLAELPTGSSLQATSDGIKKIEELLFDLPEGELESFATRIGFNPWLEVEGKNQAALSVSLTPYATRDRTADEIVEELRQETKGLEGFEEVIYMIETGGPPVGRPVSLRIVGTNGDFRTAVADSVEAFLGNIKGVKDIQRNDKCGKEQIEIKINHGKLARLGLTVADVARNVRIACDGEVATSVRYGDEDVDFRVIFEKKDYEQLSDIRELPIANRRGRLIPLGEVARLDTRTGQGAIRHYEGERTVTVNADIDQNVTTAVDVTDSVLGHFDLSRNWPGTRFVLGGEVMETEESVANLMKTFIIAIVAIYFLLVLLFNSFVQPLSVVVAIPFGIVGVVIAFALHGEPMSFVGMLGVIGLAGVVVNDSLVLVSHINRLRRENPDEPVLDIVAQGTADRLRAVILTTLTTVGGLLPLAYGLGGTDPFMAPAALALGYGLLFATPLTLVLVPCLYLIQDQITRAMGRMFSRNQ
jgi:multidrug efflux pump subunit AcrB